MKKTTAAVKADPLVERKNTPIPTYPLGPNELEIILHISWDGKNFIPSTRPPKNAISGTDDEIITHLRSLSFKPDYRKIEERTVDVLVKDKDQLETIERRAHRIQVTSSTGKVPKFLSNNDWNAGKPGVEKSDGCGILLVRPVR